MRGIIKATLILILNTSLAFANSVDWQEHEPLFHLSYEKSLLNLLPILLVTVIWHNMAASQPYVDHTAGTEIPTLESV